MKLVPPLPFRQFSASYDSTTKIISAVICVLLGAIALVTHQVVVGGVGAALVLLAFAYSPRAYVIEEGSILVRRLIGSARIPLDGIREARAATSADLSGCIRLWGVGGLFGYYGLFRTAKLGNCWWYVTNRQHIVVVITGQKTTVLSPDDVDGLLASIRASVMVPEGPAHSALLDSLPSQTAGSRMGAFIGIAVVLVVVAVLVFAFSYSPGPPGYTMTPTSLTIHDRFYPVTVQAAAVAVDRICVVDIGRDPEWRPTGRTNGFANAHYHSGWFRLANGQKVRMYWADGRRLVLLPPKGQTSPVLVEVNRPEQFVRELRQDWASGS